MRVVAVVNEKGGAGKSTLSINLAAALAIAGDRAEHRDRPGFLERFVQRPQLFTSLRVSTSQPSAGSPLQSPWPSAQPIPPLPPVPLVVLLAALALSWRAARKSIPGSS